MNYEDATELAARKHKGQYRKGGGLYISHPLTVAERFDDEDYKIVAVLHDTLEDTDLTTYELVRDYNPKPKVLDALEAITKTEGQTYLDFILQIKRNKIATAVKIEDINHNLSDLGKGNLREKYLMALYILCSKEPDPK